jgi:hypothetical protein
MQDDQNRGLLNADDKAEMQQVNAKLAQLDNMLVK